MLYQDSSGESDYSRQALKRVGECNPREAGRLVSLLPRLSQKRYCPADKRPGVFSGELQ